MVCYYSGAIDSLADATTVMYIQMAFIYIIGDGEIYLACRAVQFQSFE